MINKNTRQILSKVFGHTEEYIDRFMQIATEADIILEDFLLGKVYSNCAYTTEENHEIVKTLKFLVEQQFAKATPHAKPKYTASAGAPGAGKTFAITKMFSIDVAKNQFSDAILIGPDSVVLAQMDLYKRYSKNDPKAAYTRLRDPSNFIANFMFVKAIADNLDIIHDTTATSPKMGTILNTLHKQGYTCDIHIYVADKAARQKAIISREQKLGFSVTPEEVVSKAKDIYERIATSAYQKWDIDSLTMYAQYGEFWTGNGATVAFASYERDPNNKEQGIQVLTNGQEHVDYILAQIANEDLTTKLQESLAQTIGSWHKPPRNVLKAKL